MLGTKNDCFENANHFFTEKFSKIFRKISPAPMQVRPAIVAPALAGNPERFLERNLQNLQKRATRD